MHAWQTRQARDFRWMGRQARDPIDAWDREAGAIEEAVARSKGSGVVRVGPGLGGIARRTRWIQLGFGSRLVWTTWR